MPRRSSRPEDRSRSRRGDRHGPAQHGQAAGLRGQAARGARARQEQSCRPSALYTGDWTSGNYMLPSLVLNPGAVTWHHRPRSSSARRSRSSPTTTRSRRSGWPTPPGPGCAPRSGPATRARMRVGRQLRTGVTFFNNHNATAVDERAPFGGFAQSGIGRELGSEGMHDFTETHVMAVPSELTAFTTASARTGCVAALCRQAGPFVSPHPLSARVAGTGRGPRTAGDRLGLRYWTLGMEGLMPAKGSAEWKGDVPTGGGTFTAGDSISGGYTFKSRFEDGPGSNPEQLIAAAHAACFSMALSNILAQAGHPPIGAHRRDGDAAVRRRRPDDHQDRPVPPAGCPASTRPPSPSTPRPPRRAAR